MNRQRVTEQNWVDMDLSGAYRPPVLSAQRSVILRRPGELWVYDAFEAAKPVTWEWNFHSAAEFTRVGPNRFQLVIDNKSVCLSLWSDAKTGLSKVSGHRHLLDIPRHKRHLQLETRYHGCFSVRRPQSMVRFLVQITTGRYVNLIARDQPGESGLIVPAGVPLGPSGVTWSQLGVVLRPAPG